MNTRQPLSWFGTTTAVLFGSLMAWVIVTMMVLILWVGACGLALSEGMQALEELEGLQ